MFVLNIDDDQDDGFIFMEAVRVLDPSVTCLAISKGKEAITFLSNDQVILPDYIFFGHQYA